MSLPTIFTIERLQWPFRTLLGALVAVVSVSLTYAVPPLRAFPLLLAFPTVICSAWFLGMAGSFGCAIVDVTLVDLLLTNSRFRFSTGFVDEEIRLSLFVLLSTLLGVLLRRWADQRTELENQDLKKSLLLESAQRQMAEERLRSGEALRDRDATLQIALRASGMGLWTWDLQSGTVHWSDEVYRILGNEPGDFPADNERWFNAIHPDDAEAVREGVALCAKTGKDFHRQYRIVRSDGSTRWIESQGRSRSDADGNPIFLMGVLSDVTNRRKSEEAMLRAEKLAVAGRLAASVAHEINNPLEAVTNLLYLISITEDPNETRQFAQSALDELLRVSMITQSTLKFHRQPGTPKITMLSEILEGVVNMFRPRLKAANVTLDFRVRNEVAISCMPSEAQQIFSNLVSNAIEAIPSGGRISIRMRTSHDWRTPSQQGMRITVADSGSGMDPATMKRIFEPFFTTKSETGTGLGMWVVAQLIERHNGHIAVRSSHRHGKTGTTFSIFLPAGLEGPIPGIEIAERANSSVPIETASLLPARS